MSVLDTVFTYKLLKLVTTPWKKHAGYKLKILDDTGKLLIPYSEMNDEQKSTYNTFYRMGVNMKRFLEKIPGGKTRIGSYSAALWFLQEQLHNDRFNFLYEEMANVAPGSDGSGVPTVEKPLTKKKLKKKKKTVILKRKSEVMEEKYLLNTIKRIGSGGEDESLEEKMIRVIRGKKKVKLKRPSVRKKGYKSVDGKNVRMSAKEKLNRKKAQRKGAKKRRIKTKRSNIRRAKSMRLKH